MMQLTEKMSSKFNNMSFLCACMIVAIHIPYEGKCGSFFWYVHYVIRSGFCILAVPFFFFTSGFFLSRHVEESRWWKSEMKKRLRTLLIPYFFWSCLWAVFIFLAIAFERVLLPEAENAKAVPGFSFIVSGILGVIPWRGPWLGAFWYIRNLFLLCLCSFPIAWAIKSSRRTGAIVISLFVVFYAMVPYWGVYLPFVNHYVGDSFRYFFSLEGLVYFSIGIFIRLFPFRIHISISKAILLLLVSGLSFLLTAWAASQNLSWLAYPRWAAIPLAAVAIWRFIPDRPWPRLFITSSFPVFCIHSFVIYFLMAVLGVFGMYDSMVHSFAGYTAVYIVVLCVSLGLTILFRTCLPWLSVAAFGGR